LSQLGDRLRTAARGKVRAQLAQPRLRRLFGRLIFDRERRQWQHRQPDRDEGGD
jgi:hypothetical protein